MAKLFKSLLMLAVLSSLFCINSIAQNTAVSATVTDPNGQPYSWGTYTITFQKNPKAQTAPAGYCINGNQSQCVNLGPYTGVLNSSGAFSVTLINGDNSLLTPGGSQWQFVVCSDTGAGGPNQSSSGCTTVTLPVSGSTDNISSTINAAALPIQVIGVTPMATAYSSSEVQPGRDGTFFFPINSNSQKTIDVWFQGSWYPIGGSGSGICGGLGSNLGDTCIYTGSAWVIFPANNSGTKVFTEASNGAYSWQPYNNNTGTYAEGLIPLDTSNCTMAGGILCTDFIRTPLPVQSSYVYRGPPLWSQGLPYLVTPNSCQDLTGTENIATCTTNPIIAGQMIIWNIQSTGALGCNTGVLPGVPTDGVNTWQQLFQSGGSGAYYTVAAASGIFSISQTLRGNCSWMVQIQPVVGNASSPIDQLSTPTGGCSGSGVLTFNSVTTTTPDTIIAIIQQGPSILGVPGVYGDGTGYNITGQLNSASPLMSLAIEAGAFPTPGTYTPAMTLLSANCPEWSGGSVTVALKSAGGTSGEIPQFGQVYPIDIVGFPAQSSATTNYVLQSNGANGAPMGWVNPGNLLANVPLTFSTLPSPPTAGMQFYCSDCQVTTAASCTTNAPASCVCKGSGTGAFAKYMNYQANGANWYCQ